MLLNGLALFPNIEIKYKGIVLLASLEAIVFLLINHIVNFCHWSYYITGSFHDFVSFCASIFRCTFFT